MQNENINTPVTENVSTPVETNPVSPAPVESPTESSTTPTPVESQSLASESVVETPTKESEPTPKAQSAEPKILPTLFDKGGVIGLLQKAKEKIQFRKRAKLEKIMDLVQNKSRVTNDDVQRLLRCSDATATRYLAELVKQGRLRRIGAGPALIYEFLR